MAASRQYTMGARADAAAQTADRILEAALALFIASSYDDVSLKAVAERAGVTEKTVLRRFGSKDALLMACARVYGPREQQQRVAAPGDIRGAARVLAARYEATLDMMARHWALEDRIEAVGEVIQKARRSHQAWLASVFAPYLPRRGSELYRRRLAELIGATELAVWHIWRRRFRLSARLAEDALTETLEALIAHWKTQKRREQR